MSDKDGLWVPARRAMTIGLVLLVTLVAFEALAVNTALPEASKELGGLGLYGWVFSGFMLATVASIAVSGRAIDERGLHPVLAAGAPLFCIGLLIGATAPSMIALVGGRVVQGLGAGAISSVANVSIGRAYPPRLRAPMIAVMSSSWIVPGMVGPSASALITSSVGWRWVFAGLIPIVGGAALLTLPALRPFGPTGAEHGHTHRTVDPLRLAVGFGFVIGGLSNAHDVWPLALIVVGLVIAVSALRRVSPPGTFQLVRGAPAAIVLNFVINFAFFSTDAFLPLAVKDVRHRGVGFAGLALTIGTLSWTAGSWINARFGDRVPITTRVRLGFAFVATGCALVLVGLGPGVPIAIFPLAWLVAGLGMGLGYSGISLTVLGAGEGAEDDGGVAGAVVAARQIFDTLGTATGAGVAGACVAIAEAGQHTTRSALTIAFALMIAVALVGVTLSGRVSAPATTLSETAA